ncbi:hypothetical protein [Planctomyces sp. SH-PL62]|uniref:hypothetical protein n=1 Tax=Planctomyces sp. SH-PL62 TaxID=1636152 RepID=UPI0012E7A689|nr:hypothetical protein [Planctomyces sp. SH-PL62]
MDWNTDMGSENSIDKKQKALRDELWPDAGSWIWDRTDKVNVKGYATIPRLLPLIMILIDELSEKGEGDARLAYLELWSRARDQHIISITDEEDIAFASNCTNPKRAVRTWKDHIKVLKRLGFILVESDGNREFGHILLLNPLAVAARLHAEGRTPPRWWSTFKRRAVEIGAKIPDASILPALTLE